MSDWVRRAFDSIGGTQSPPGAYLKVLQDKYMGKVFLCIDVSGSMSENAGGGKTRLQAAVAGAKVFVKEAVAAHYQVGLILWDDSVHVFVPLSGDPAAVDTALSRATIAGGTALAPTLTKGIDQLRKLRGDRVIAIFSDGEIPDIRRARELSKEAARLEIRILVRGLGRSAAASLEQVATEGDVAENVVGTSAEIESGIASMARRIINRKGRP
ncbi:Mg-chelatase subunit ChlD [Allocatelliglobosispora scoriae]|uniref:Mg-chelatase subunit ChlD n=1 Tax=Allocatelliglobosispora scoriae TaxID=643052 RepID=A0A841BZQ7_9ACTN|nr:VWA domain-containing protein [Allocatelliglobosispora scoriae]MBB5872978.1 Mg-chelatase subunit ChlD [Allocatelliglobosispora scoriae]